eukprot:gnl/Dysnectes_brevis/2620_a3166_1049.p1 GENE.gnl/Dysnectes_brevis/2620_a3166_1049~~gnl/Dysnectes_brevis/2620_a3166_1049.p1  ORF type:complete len:472 (+),score=197.36 gnl/Dysnectes_brevis/2620_a3166_1049:163-1578(+)
MSDPKSEIEAKPVEQASVPASELPVKRPAEEPLPTDIEPPKKKFVRIKTRAFILQLSYMGTHFSGSQINPRVRTVEGELYAAIEAAGVAEGKTRKEIGLTRGSRTDKGVSAAIATFSAFLSEYPDLEARIRAHLPPDINLVTARRTVPSFNAKNFCTSRHYQYLMPAALLRAQDKYAEKKAWFEAELQKLEDAGELEKLPGLARDGGQFLLRHLASADRTDVIGTLNELANACFCTKTRSYHNFTAKGAKARKNMASNRRVIRRVELHPLETLSGSEGRTMEVSRVEIHGDSFLMWQIRRMMATLVLVARGQAPPAFVNLALLTSEQVTTPTAPGCFLMLRRPEFSWFNKRFPKHAAIISESDMAAADVYCKDHIEPDIVNSALTSEAVEEFEAWLDEECEHDFYDIALTAIKHQIVLAEELAVKRAEWAAKEEAKKAEKAKLEAEKAAKEAEEAATEAAPAEDAPEVENE